MLPLQGEAGLIVVEPFPPPGPVHQFEIAAGVIAVTVETDVSIDIDYLVVVAAPLIKPLAYERMTDEALIGGRTLTQFVAFRTIGDPFKRFVRGR